MTFLGTMVKKVGIPFVRYPLGVQRGKQVKIKCLNGDRFDPANWKVSRPNEA